MIRPNQNRRILGLRYLDLPAAQDQFEKAKRICPVLKSAVLAAFIATVNIGCASGPRSAPPFSSATPASAAVQITTPNLLAGEVTSTYQVTLSASGGQSPYNWSLKSGSLPLGLSLASSSGTISGSATQAGNFAFSIQAKDSAIPANTAIKALSLSIGPAPSSMQITTSSLPGGQIISTYQATLSASGGVGPYRWSTTSGSLPAGVALSPISGVLAGIPIEAGQFRFVAQVSDSSSPSAKIATQALQLNVSQPSAQGVTASPNLSGQVAIQWGAISGTSSYQVYVDDTPNFVQPIVSQSVNQTSLTLNALDVGFSPGVTYYVKVNPGGAGTTFRLDVQTWSEPYLNYSYARTTWENLGRPWLTTFSGINWHDPTQSWILDPNWSHALNDVAQQAYYVELAARAASNMGAVRDPALLNELAEFYVAFEPRFTTLGAMRAMGHYNSSLLQTAGPDSTKTLLWVWPNGGVTYVRECELCNAQFLHPVARLIRIITTLPASQRTAAMQNFVSWYGPVVIQDHLLRLLWGNGGWLVKQYKNTPNYISDRDLWLMAATAEILGANANEPALVPLTAPEKSNLQEAVQVGTSALQTKYKTLYPDTQNFQGQVVGSSSYFNGQYASAADHAYSAYRGPTFPTSANRAASPTASWDVSHFYRVPVFFRSLYDNKKATGTSFPSRSDAQLLVNHLAYRNFQGDLSRPLFNNYFDGGNGWYNVSGATGYPPAEDCNYLDPNRRCLTQGSVQGWGLLSFFSPDLMEIQHSLLTLAWSKDPLIVTFRERYYHHSFYYQGEYNSKPYYSEMLLWILSAVPEKLQ